MFINQKRLNYFHTVYTHGKIQRAADYLNTHSSVITRHIQLLEQEMSAKLFERRPRGMVPTEAGELLMEYYRGQYKLEETLKTGLQELEQRGRIRLAMPTTFVAPLMSTFNNFRRQYPHVHLQIEEIFESNKIANLITEDIVHIGIVHCCPNFPDVLYYASELLPVRLLVNKNHPLSGKNKVTFSEAVSYPFSLAAAPDIFSAAIKAAALSEKIELPSPIFVSNSTVARKNFACMGSAAVFMSEFSAYEEIKTEKLVALEIEHPVFNSAELNIIVRRGKRLSSATNQLLRLLSARLPIFGQHKSYASDSQMQLGASHA